MSLIIAWLKHIDHIQPRLPKLVQDYFDQTDSTRDLYAHNPTLEGVIKAAELRKANQIDRNGLTEVLLEQAQNSAYASQVALSQIELLKSEGVFTVTTGHQCCLYGGPMYFLYKIASTIKLSRMLADKGVKTVPVFWMATEDHDFEEVNHVFIQGQKVEWDSQQSGAVGRMSLTNMDAFKHELATVLEHDPLKRETLEVVNKIYSQDKTLGEATRDLVYWFFAEEGIVVLDADDARLKQALLPVIKQELSTSDSKRIIDATNERIDKLEYKVQVTPREINLFYLLDGYRDRIVRTELGFATSDNSYAWTESEMKAEVDEYPERFSPNVILRPVYQELILPNLAYIGGPGELSYWLQLKANFDFHQVFFPTLLLRDMAMIVTDKSMKKMEQLDIGFDQILQNRDQLFVSLVRKAGTHEDLLDKQIEANVVLMSDLIDKLVEIDPNLALSAQTERARIQNRLVALKKKVLRSDKKKHAIIAQRIDAVLAQIMPLNTPQERIDNWMQWMSVDSRKRFVNRVLTDFNAFERVVQVYEV